MRPRPWGLTRLPHSGVLHLVTPQELGDLRESLRLGRVPFDLQVKLATLAGTEVLHHFVEQNSRLFLALLLAAQEGLFRHGTMGERDRLIRVLAYVRKNDDAVPDWQPGGYVDDHQEVRAAAQELAPLLREFKHWRLCHEVPRLWFSGRPTQACRRIMSRNQETLSHVER